MGHFIRDFPDRRDGAWAIPSAPVHHPNRVQRVTVGTSAY